MYGAAQTERGHQSRRAPSLHSVEIHARWPMRRSGAVGVLLLNSIYEPLTALPIGVPW